MNDWPPIQRRPYLSKPYFGIINLSFGHLNMGDYTILGSVMIMGYGFQLSRRR